MVKQAFLENVEEVYTARDKFNFLTPFLLSQCKNLKKTSIRSCHYLAEDLLTNYNEVEPKIIKFFEHMRGIEHLGLFFNENHTTDDEFDSYYVDMINSQKKLKSL